MKVGQRVEAAGWGITLAGVGVMGISVGIQLIRYAGLQFKEAYTGEKQEGTLFAERSTKAAETPPSTTSAAA